MEDSFDKELEIANALAELVEAFDFTMRIYRLKLKQMRKEVRARDPSFIEHIKAMGKPPKTAADFWEGWSIWSVTGLCSKYRHIWDKVIKAYFLSEARSKVTEKYKLKEAVESQINKILKDSAF